MKTTTMKIIKKRDVTLPLLFSDGAVLQQKTLVRFYGSATPAERVEVSIARQRGTTMANADGDWELFLGPFPSGGPHRLTVQGISNTITRKDIYFGEVWVCSGQSNMEMSMMWNPALQGEVAKVNDPLLRMFTVEKAITPTPQKEVKGGKWEAATPEVGGHFSAVGYYFAQKLREELGVPVGMIHSSWGGTRIEAWTEESILRAEGMSPNEFMQEDTSATGRARKAALSVRQEAWKKAGSPTGVFTDVGRAKFTHDWVLPGIAGWNTVAVPGEWNTLGIEELRDIDGAVWFKREFNLPANWDTNASAVLSLGAIDDMDVTYINGIEVGKTGAETPNHWAVLRKYIVSSGVLKTGKNVLAVRVWDGQGGGGFVSMANELYLEGKNAKIALGDARGDARADSRGAWRYRIEKVRPSSPGEAVASANPNAASVLYNAMLFPLRKYTIQGTIWYQGESNAGNPSAYRRQLPAMITNWRKDFTRPDMPFGIVQLASFQAINPQPEDTGWAQLRDAQTNAALTMRNVGLAVLTDVGNVADIHPVPKRPVGERLAYWALGSVYQKRFPTSGPLFRKLTRRNDQQDKLIVEFSGKGGALMAKPIDSAKNPVPDGKVLGFAIAGGDGKYVWAEAKIIAPQTVELSAPGLANPTKVRFGWANFPIVNLFDSFGLPVVPFQAEIRR